MKTNKKLFFSRDKEGKYVWTKMIFSVRECFIKFGNKYNFREIILIFRKKIIYIAFCAIPT